MKNQFLDHLCLVVAAAFVVVSTTALALEVFGDTSKPPSTTQAQLEAAPAQGA
jgi:hypothetical protein